MAEYESGYAYIETATSIKQKVACIDSIIDGLLNSALKAVENEDISEYWLDDGQTKIKTVYRSAAEVMKSINSFEKIRNIYLNRINGFSVQLIDKNSNS
jgi:peptidyl-tRNA hydrolase